LNEKTGLTVPPGDPNALADAIQRLVNNDSERITFGKNAKERVNIHFRLDSMNNNIFNLYNKLITKKL
jgi:rhamnosyl/mannosyltransferase